jgi:hypothetical protein
VTLTAERNTQQIGSAGFPALFEPAAATDIFYAGAMVCLNTAGLASPAGAAAGQSVVIGRCERTVDNSAGLTPAPTVPILPGTFKWTNSGTSIATANIGALCYAVDDESVHLDDAGSSRPVAGVIVRVDADGVVVQSLFSSSAAVANNGGRVRRITRAITTANLTTAALSQTINFANAIEAGSRILGHSIALATPFTGGGASACTLDLGDAGDTDALIDGADIFAAAVDGEASAITLGISPNKSFAAATTLSVTITSDVNVSTLAAGSLTVSVLYAVTA